MSTDPSRWVCYCSIVPLRVTITRRVKFSAAHRYYKDEWDEAKNLATFGDNVKLHGHNYVLEATAAGVVDQETGMAADITVLDRELAAIGQDLGNREITESVDGLAGKVPTTENLALFAWNRLNDRGDGIRLVRVRLYESPELYVEITEESS